MLEMLGFFYSRRMKITNRVTDKCLQVLNYLQEAVPYFPLRILAVLHLSFSFA